MYIIENRSNRPDIVSIFLNTSPFIKKSNRILISIQIKSGNTPLLHSRKIMGNP
jgi:hypothetical protein